MFAPRAGGAALRQCWRRYPVRKVTRRRYSIPSGPGSIAPSPASPYGIITTEIDRIAPRFEVNASQIQILKSPSSFYDTLKTKILSAKKRVYLSTLYVGKTEDELISTIDEALKKNPDLQVSILTDALRGTREAPKTSCASLLASLVAAHGDRVEIRMFHTPNLVGLRKKFIPKRINEGWGLQHMKLYGFDDEIILSGANLSTDYFTNRVDRYHVFSSRELTDFYAQIHDAVCSISYRVLPDPHSEQGFLLDWPTANGCPSPLDDQTAFRKHAQHLLEPLIQPQKTSQTTNTLSTKTVVYPLGQFTSLFKPNDTSTEFPVLTHVLKQLSESPVWKHSSWTFTAGYFNMHPTIASLLVSGAPTTSKPPDGPCTVITASPWANGFYGSAGVSGMLPAAYTYLSRKFLERVSRAGKGDGIKLLEWRKGTVGEPDGWTYHAKGIWITPPSSPSVPVTEGSITSSQSETSTLATTEQASIGPAITLIGSSNYTKRSYALDLEVGALIVTEDEALRQKLKEETELLQQNASQVTIKDLTTNPERKVGWKVKIAMWIVEVVGGAL